MISMPDGEPTGLVSWTSPVLGNYLFTDGKAVAVFLVMRDDGVKETQGGHDFDGHLG